MTAARIFPKKSSISVVGEYNNASIVLRSRSPTNESAPTTEENINGMIRNSGASIKAVK